MIIKSIDLENFRNYETLHLELSQGIHIFYGDNAQGKTNLLEAISVAAANKSHRGSKDREMIRFGSEESHIKMVVEKRGIDHRIDVHLKGNKNKGIAVDSMPVKRARDFAGLFNVVLFSPEDLQIVKEGPQERRKFIDAELCQLDKFYTNNFIRYKKILEQRNQLLKDIYFTPSLRDTLDVWDEQLVSCGKEIIHARREFIESLRELTKPVHAHISGGKEELILGYEPDVCEDKFETALRNAREKDLKAKTTTVGPHRDDMSFILDGIDARIYGSQGQQRTCALSLKMAEIELVKEKAKDAPVLLLDDVLSELDSGRQAFLLDSIHDIQTVITCTGLEDFVNHRFETDFVYQVSKGNVSVGKPI